jgi:hypothetical protein
VADRYPIGISRRKAEIQGVSLFFHEAPICKWTETKLAASMRRVQYPMRHCASDEGIKLSRDRLGECCLP